MRKKEVKEAEPFFIDRSSTDCFQLCFLNVNTLVHSEINHMQEINFTQIFENGKNDDKKENKEGKREQINK